MAKTQEVTIIARYELKADSSQVFYKVRSCSDATKEYCVTCLDGVAIECDCPARKPCKHMRHCTHLEAQRNNHTEQAVVMPAQPVVETQRAENIEKTAVTAETHQDSSPTLARDVTPIVASRASTAELSLSHSFLMRGQRTGGALANVS